MDALHPSIHHHKSDKHDMVDVNENSGMHSLTTDGGGGLKHRRGSSRCMPGCRPPVCRWRWAPGWWVACRGQPPWLRCGESVDKALALLDDQNGRIEKKNPHLLYSTNS